MEIADRCDTARSIARERRATEEAIRSGKKTAWEIQVENFLFPMHATVKIDWADLSERFERAQD